MCSRVYLSKQQFMNGAAPGGRLFGPKEEAGAEGFYKWTRKPSKGNTQLNKASFRRCQQKAPP
jgi:hypothetical protein